MKIYAFSIDMKLDAEGQGYKILEINDALCSGFTGYNAATETEMISDVIIPDYREMFPDHEVVSLTNPVIEDPARPLIMIPRSDAMIERYTRLQLVHHSCTDLIHINSDLRFINFCTNKAFQSEVFASDERLKDLHPETRIITTLARDLDENSAWANALPDQVILKPSKDYGGNGVMIIQGANSKEQIFNILKDRQYKKNKEPWCGFRGFTAVVQDLLPPNLIDVFGCMHDATMRVAVTVWQEKDGAPFQCKIHDAYWKPSASPYEGVDNRNSRISYSPSYREPYKRDNILDKFRDQFRLMTLGDFGLSFQNHVDGVAVDDEIKSWLFPELSRSMSVLIQEAVSKPMGDRVLEWLQSDRRELRALAVSVAIQGDYFPESNAAEGRDVVRLMYPPHVVESLKQYILKHHKTDTLAYNTITEWVQADGTMACENEEEGLKQPLRSTISFAVQQKVVNDVGAFMMRHLRI